MAITEISVSKIYVLATEPTNKVKDRFWFDTTNNLLKRYDGTSWKPISVSSDDVVVLSSGNKISLTNYLNTQIAALAEGIDSKQDKLETYFEEVTEYNSKATIGAYEVKTNAAYVSITGGDDVTIDGGSVTIDSSSDVVINGAVSGTAISTSIPASINAASDNKILSEKAVADAISTKQDKLLYYSERSVGTPSATISVKNIKLNGSVAEGDGTTASGSYSHAEGGGTKTYGLNSHAEGYKTIAYSSYQHVQGKYNIDDTGNKYADIIGNGSSASAKSNAATVSWDGITWSQTDVRAGGTDQDNATYSLVNLSESKQDKLTFYYEDISTNQEASIQNADSFSIKNTNQGLILDNNNGGITIQSSTFNTGKGVISIANNIWEDSSDPILFDINGDGIKISDALKIPEIKNKQNSTDTALNTTNKTIVGAINELLASINANVITSTEQKRITTTSTSTGIQMSTTAKACMVSINPVNTNVGAIYISTSSDTAPTINPLYPDQMPKYKFPDASQVYIWSDITGDSVDLTIEYYG